jgi:SPP1 gp7 family putative phage head morphogenesis protein
MPNFHRPRRIEEEYRRALNALMESWLRVFPHNPRLEEISSFLGNGGGERVMKASDSLARRMVTAVAVQNERSWREAAAKSTQGRRIYDLLRNEMAGSVGASMRQMIASHAALIRSMPERMAQDLASQIATRQMRGERAETIAADIAKRFPHITRAHTAMLARTEVSSAATSISEARAAHLSLPCYEWLSSEDVRVRPSHRLMDHVIVFWRDPPAPEALAGIKSRLGHYQVGRCPSCRCDANVIVDLDQISFPAKVYHDGRIERMSRARFSKLYH